MPGRQAARAPREETSVSDPIRVFVTGGTFDKEYDELSGRLYFKDTHVPEMLRLARCRLESSVRTLMMIDSLEMTDADRAAVVESCRSAPERRDRHDARHRHHGRDGARAARRGDRKTIVLTGAMVPYAFGTSDGLFNLGSALSFAQVLPPGVYVAMNGRCFAGDRVRKNRERGSSRRSTGGLIAIPRTGLGLSLRSSGARAARCGGAGRCRRRSGLPGSDRYVGVAPGVGRPSPRDGPPRFASVSVKRPIQSSP